MDDNKPQLELSDVAPFVFKEDSEADTLFKAIMENLETWIDTESDEAISQDTIGEARIHACGRVSAVKDLRSQLNHLREQASLL
ncbi:MAG: hypothetical protein CMM02_05365 [Rhodopirellula sp.]|jgi:hypothetical protein|nr:hypothetical protein [Rhodopirellula sp.]|tara:strand:+ start:2657 stop:2908 length:252 start_codon:yes stop_codon:yes gene_type:complete